MCFERICEELRLGRLTAAPQPLSGGHSHRMFALATDRGRLEPCRYAVKLLNPEVMQRPDALDNYRSCEAFEAMMEAAGIPILPALTIDGRKMHCVDGQYLYVFDYYEGKPRYNDELTVAHCEKMGRVLAAIHALGRREGESVRLPEPVDWEALARPLLADEASLSEGQLLLEAAPMLTRVSAAAEAAIMALPRVEAVCHNDMDAKNVLWQGEDFRIIDLECLGWADPRRELLDLAISWATWPLNGDKLMAFVRAYYAAGGERLVDAALVFDGRSNHLDWLAYNTRRALSEDAQERAVGRSQIRDTVGRIRFDQQHREQVLAWMKAAEA